MPNSSPYDMIHKARRYAAAADRWAVLKANTHDRTPINPAPQQAPPVQQAPAPAAPLQAASVPGSPAQPPPYQPAPPVEHGQPQLMQPPFPPPQPRHPYMDEILQRHEQAWKSASPLQAWTPEQPPQGPWRDPVQMPANAPAAPAALNNAHQTPAQPPEPSPQPAAEVGGGPIAPEPWTEA